MLLLLVLVILSAVFLVLLGLRISAARRHALLRRWPALFLAAVGLVLMLRGAYVTGAVMAGLAALAWMFWPTASRHRPSGQAPQTQAEREARALLGVGPDASEAEIRRAFRDKIAAAHPDRGGTTERAAKLAAARDLLLRRR